MNWRRTIGLLGVVACLAACSDSAGWNAQDAGDIARTDGPGTDLAADARVVQAPVVVGVVPNHGAFSGGTEVTVRGSHFTEGTVVRFGGNMVQPRYTQYVDEHRIVVLTPAGTPGQVDVQVDAAGQTSRLPRAFHYDNFYVDPGVGPTTGNARVSLHGSGTHFADGMSISFEALPCTGVRVTSPELASCLTPAHPDGRVTVDYAAGPEEMSVDEAYLYSDASGDTGGGLAGGESHGSLTVLVLAGETGEPIPSVNVFLYDMPGTVPPYAGLTNERGQVTLSPPELRVPITVTATKECKTTTTIQTFNATTATIYLFQTCMSPGGGGGAGRPPVYPATITGELVWDGPNEFAPNPWANIPEPRMGERRVAHVYTSRTSIYEQDPTPETVATLTATVRELVTPGYGGHGYPYRLVARPASIAVYALAGLETTTTPVRFTPYVMGVARRVLGAPRATVAHVDILMNIPLDHTMPVQVRDLPPQVAGEPSQVYGMVFLDLGGEGFIPRPEIAVSGRSESDTYRFVGLPGLSGALSDARLSVHMRYASGDVVGPDPFAYDPMHPERNFTPQPFSGIIVSGITTPDAPVRADNWLGVPNLVAPRAGERLPTDRTVRFEISAGSPDFLELQLASSSSAWQHFAPGADRAVRYPDLSGIMGLADLPAGQPLQLSVIGVRIPGFDFNHFTYTQVGQPYWTAYAARAVLVLR